MIKFTAQIPARTIVSKTGKVFKYPAYSQDFEQDDAGSWRGLLLGKMENMTEAEVIDVCKKDLAWPEIRAKYFSMHGFHG